jgi:archaemetzincin
VKWRLHTLRIVPVGTGFPLELRKRLGESVSRTFGCSVSTDEPAIDPEFAFDLARGQYYASRLLERLSVCVGADDGRVLGVTMLDLYVPVLTFVFGEAQLSGRCAVISAHRLREEFYGLPARAELVAERLEKAALHELGHTYGLHHCEDWECVMASAHAVERVDVKGSTFCAECLRQIRLAG